MVWNWAWAVLNAVGMAALGWAGAHSIDLGCDFRLTGGCGVPDGGGLYFAVLMVAPLLLFFVLLAGMSKSRDWRPMLGISVGAVVGCVVAFSVGTSVGYWVLALVLVAIGAVVPWGMWRLLKRVS